ncbi:hypothetical protein DFH06DRAFT_1391240 [Mycena polygramma]|nr:hypothetical protein DFH06DRAFT_1391240 [Mycena polygramma]
MPASHFLLASFISDYVGTVGGGTVKSWMSGIKAWHDINGAPWFGEDRWVELARRTANKEGTAFKREQRGPVTIEHMIALRAALDLTKPFDAAVWAIACAAFWGCRRLGELVVPSAAKFNPKFHATRRTQTRRIAGAHPAFTFRVPWTKMSRERGGTVTLTIRLDDELCPETAFQNHLRAYDKEKLAEVAKAFEAFRVANGIAVNNDNFHLNAIQYRPPLQLFAGAAGPRRRRRNPTFCELPLWFGAVGFRASRVPSSPLFRCPTRSGSPLPLEALSRKRVRRRVSQRVPSVASRPLHSFCSRPRSGRAVEPEALPPTHNIIDISLHRFGCMGTLTELTLAFCTTPAEEIITILKQLPSLTALSLDLSLEISIPPAPIVAALMAAERLCPNLISLSWADQEDSLDRTAFADMVVSRCAPSSGVHPLRFVAVYSGRRRMKGAGWRMRGLPGLEVVTMNRKKGAPAVLGWRGRGSSLTAIGLPVWL